jgi:hypothetical protein
MGRLGVHVARAQSWDRARQTARRDERERDDDPRQKVIRDSGARDARCPCGGGEPRFGTACFPRRAALARISHQDPGPCVPPARCATRSGPAPEASGAGAAARCAGGPRATRPAPWGRCALRGWPQGHAPCALDRAPPLTLRGATRAIASRFRDPTGPRRLASGDAALAGRPVRVHVCTCHSDCFGDVRSSSEFSTAHTHDAPTPHAHTWRHHTS